MGRRSELQIQRPQLCSLVIRFSVPVIVLAWVAAAWPDTTALKGIAPMARISHATQQSLHAPALRPDGLAGRQSSVLRKGSVGGNWAGYTITEHAPFLSAAGTWTIPTVSWVDYPPDPLGRKIYESNAVWIGIGGAPDIVLIQLGTGQLVTKSGGAVYYVWYELFPAAPIMIDATRFAVSPGDAMTASLQCIATCTPGGTSTWVMSMQDVTRWKTPFTIRVLNTKTNLASAEWIMEDDGVYGCDSSTCQLITSAYLPNYSLTTFSNISVNNANPNLSAQDAMMVTDPEGKAWSVPSNPVGGNSFTVRYVPPPGST